MLRDAETVNARLLHEHPKNAVLVERECQVEALGDCAIRCRCKIQSCRDDSICMISGDRILIDLVIHVGIKSEVRVIDQLAEPITERLPFARWNHNFDWLVSENLLGPRILLSKMRGRKSANKLS